MIAVRMCLAGIVAAFIGCDSTAVDTASAEAIINEIRAEYDEESNALNGSMAVTVRNTGTRDVLWWSCPANLQRQEASGNWTGVYSRPCILVPQWVTIPVGQEATEIIGLPGRLGQPGSGHWAAPFSGAYRMSNIILAHPNGTAIHGARVISPIYFLSMSGADEP